MSSSFSHGPPLPSRVKASVFIAFCEAYNEMLNVLDRAKSSYLIDAIDSIKSAAHKLRLIKCYTYGSAT